MAHRLILVIFLSLSIPGFSQYHWETILFDHMEWSYLPASSAPPAGWNQPGFDASGWAKGKGGFGFGDDDDSTIVSGFNSLYLVKEFTIPTGPVFRNFLLDIDYDDAFVAWIDGIEVARSSNISDAVPLYNSTLSTDHEALLYRGIDPERFVISKVQPGAGNHVLAVQVLNTSPASSDFTARVFLHVETNAPDPVFHSLPSWFDAPMLVTESHLPLIMINTGNKSIPDDPKLLVELKVIDNGPGQMNHPGDPANAYQGFAAIEVRGSSSQMFPKKSYQFETRDNTGENLNVSLLGMPAENDWVLNGPYSDKSLLRNVLVFDMSRKIGLYAPRCKYCELFLNGQYQGIYVLMEEIKQDDNRVDIPKLNPDEISGENLTGGYIIRIDKTDGDYNHELDGWVSRPSPMYPNAKYITYQYVYPKSGDIVPEQKKYIQDFMLEMEKTLNGTDFKDPWLGYNRYLELSSFVNHLLLNEMTKEVDKYVFSTYFYKQSDKNGGQLFMGPPWDYNLGFGNVNYYNESLITQNWLYPLVYSTGGRNYLWKRMMEDPWFAKLSRSRWIELRDGVLSDQAIHNMIDSITDYLGTAIERNYQKWPILGTYIWPNYDWENNNYEDEVDWVRSWLMNRITWMDANLTGTILSPSATLGFQGIVKGSFPIQAVLKLSLKDDYFEQRRLLSEHFRFVTTGASMVTDSVVWIGPSEAYIYASADDLFNPVIDARVIAGEEMLCGFSDLTSNTVSIDARVETEVHQPVSRIYTFGNTMMLTCDNPGSLPSHLMVYNVTGSQVAAYPIEPQYQNRIDTGLPPGIYIAVLNTAGGVVHKFVVP